MFFANPMTAELIQLIFGFLGITDFSPLNPCTPRIEKVVLVHGIFENGQAFTKLRNRLERHGIDCFVPELKPMDARDGVDQLAHKLKSGIDQRFGKEAKLSIISFSMGGLVSRYYLQNLGGAERCQTLVTISTPHHGTKTAYFYFGEGARQMRPKSNFLRQLQETEDSLKGIDILSYRTPLDLMILPSKSSVWQIAENRVYYSLLHSFMLHAKPVLDEVEKRLIISE